MVMLRYATPSMDKTGKFYQIMHHPVSKEVAADICAVTGKENTWPTFYTTILKVVRLEGGYYWGQEVDPESKEFSVIFRNAVEEGKGVSLEKLL
jgi:hypothetical protein